jgi:hypothetical protein
MISSALRPESFADDRRALLPFRRLSRCQVRAFGGAAQLPDPSRSDGGSPPELLDYLRSEFGLTRTTAF